MTTASTWNSRGGIYPGPFETGISNVQKYSSGDERSGVRGLNPDGSPIQKYADELAPFFGRQVVYDAPNPYDAFESENYDLPKAFVGQNSFLRKVMIEKITQAECYPTIELLPWLRSPTMEIAWEEWHFGRHMLGRTPDESVSRLVTSSFTSNKESMHRWGLGLKLEHGFYKTEMGRTCYAMNLMQIQIAVIETFNHNVMDMLMNVKPYRSKFTAGNMDKNELEHAFNLEKRYWGIIHKERNAFNVIERYAGIEMQQRCGERGNHLTVPAGSYAAILERPEASLYIYDGPMRKDPLADGKVQVRESRGYTVSGQKNRVDPNFNNRVIGGYFYCTLSHLDDRDMKTFNIGMMDSLIWDEELDDMFRFSFRDNFHRAGLIKGWNQGRTTDYTSSIQSTATQDDDDYFATDDFWEHGLKPGPKRVRRTGNLGGDGGDDGDDDSGSGKLEWSLLGKRWLAEVLKPQGVEKYDKKSFIDGIQHNFEAAYQSTTWGHFYQQCGVLNKLVNQIAERKDSYTVYNHILNSIPNSANVRMFFTWLKEKGLQQQLIDTEYAKQIVAIPWLETRDDSLALSRGTLDEIWITKKTALLTFDQNEEDGLSALFQLLLGMSMGGRDKTYPTEIRAFLRKWNATHSGTGQISDDQLAAVVQKAVGEVTRLREQAAKGAAPERKVEEIGAFLNGRTLPDFQKPYQGIWNKMKAILVAGKADVTALAKEMTSHQPSEPHARIEQGEVKFEAHQIKSMLMNQASITDPSLYKVIIDNDLIPVIGLIGFRPYQRWQMGTAIYTFAGGRVGATYYKDPDFMLGDNIAQKLHEGHYTQYGKSIIMKPDLVMTIDDILGKRYLGGCGHSPWDASSNNDKNHHTQNMMANDMYICAVPINFVPADSYLDITGNTHECLRPAQTNAKAREEGTWPGCRAYAAHWGWYQNRTAVDSTDGRLNTQKRFNTLCFQDHQSLYCDGKFSGNYRVNKGHWGERLYPGCAIKHTTAGVYLEPVNYKNTAMVTIGT